MFVLKNFNCVFSLLLFLPLFICLFLYFRHFCYALVFLSVLHLHILHWEGVRMGEGRDAVGVRRFLVGVGRVLVRVRRGQERDMFGTPTEYLFHFAN